MWLSRWVDETGPRDPFLALLFCPRLRWVQDDHFPRRNRRRSSRRNVARAWRQGGSSRSRRASRSLPSPTFGARRAAGARGSTRVFPPYLGPNPCQMALLGESPVAQACSSGGKRGAIELIQNLREARERRRLRVRPARRLPRGCGRGRRLHPPEIAGRRGVSQAPVPRAARVSAGGLTSVPERSTQSERIPRRSGRPCDRRAVACRREPTSSRVTPLSRVAAEAGSETADRSADVDDDVGTRAVEIPELGGDRARRDRGRAVVGGRRLDGAKTIASPT